MKQVLCEDPKNVRRPRTKLSYNGDLMPGIYSPLRSALSVCACL